MIKYSMGEGSELVVQCFHLIGAAVVFIHGIMLCSSHIQPESILLAAVGNRQLYKIARVKLSFIKREIFAGVRKCCLCSIVNGSFFAVIYKIREPL